MMNPHELDKIQEEAKKGIALVELMALIYAIATILVSKGITTDEELAETAELVKKMPGLKEISETCQEILELCQ